MVFAIDKPKIHYAFIFFQNVDLQHFTHVNAGISIVLITLINSYVPL